MKQKSHSGRSGIFSLFSRNTLIGGLLSTTLLAPLPALASNPAYEKVALIIGNSDYVDLPDLPNATNDAAAVAQMLKQSGYLVFERNDLTKSQFSASIAEISSNLNSSSEVVFFFAGHGFQIGSENYLIPTNSAISDLSDVPLESISLTHVLEHFSTQSGSQVVLLDSCRSNPFVGQQAYSSLSGETLRIQNGFSFQSAPVNSLISFSTAPGAVALDGTGENSPYTTSLVGASGQFPEYDIASILPIVRAQVFEQTDGFQVPWESSSLLKPVFLSRAESEPVPVALTLSPEADDSAAAPRDVAAGPAQDFNVTGYVAKHVPVFSIRNPAPDGLVIASLPRNGAMGLLNGDRLRVVTPGEKLGPAAAARLVYSPDLRATRAVDAAPTLSDAITFKSGSVTINATINLDFHPCDMAAASPLDPQGLGLSVENFEMVPDTALAACTQAVAQFPNESRFHYQLYRAHVGKRQFEQAEASVNTALALGHVRAHLGLGQLELAQRQGVTSETHKPVSARILAHYMDGHKLGDPMATYMLGRQMMRHGETRTERQRGFAMLHRSKDAGYVEALNELGRYFFVSEEGDANPARGLQYFREAAARGNIQGYNSLGFIYKNGLGDISADLDQAVRNYETAASLGHATAPTSLGRIWAEGTLTNPDFRKALAWYDEGLARADAWGGFNAANLIMLGKINGMDNTHAAVRAAKAASIGAGEARKQSFDLLGQLSKKELASGLQRLLSEMGQDIGVDGVPGAQTAQAIVAVYGALVSLETEQDMLNALIKVAGAYWNASDVRVDLN